MVTYFCVSYKNKVNCILKSCKIYDGVQLYLRPNETVHTLQTSPPPFPKQKTKRKHKNRVDSVKTPSSLLFLFVSCCISWF